ncbi:ribonuclease, Rne/Rng family [Gemmobacter megaterium]|uniref:Ribonuclease, Rne/Rng family n=1 Tax=Gemmobacter megaterium TaxID=1086013 RepID=A0A1N7M8V9_9RHOB|nr:ribonuclease E/G [Gemmobacter megaterium]GGE08174.1 ribonuclease G [Gemmobacter megaterium]SIS82528.1 ribonuclease, Rne/Rng family [Gemmobacter megaterium]
MKGRVVVLDRWQGREAAALVVDGRLEDLLIDPADDNPLRPGAILRGVVDRPVKGQGGVFVKLPGGSGFLRQVSGLAPGQRVIVQITGATEPGKAAPVSLRVLFKSRLAIVTPGAPGLNISRRIKDEDLRGDLQSLAAEAMAGAAQDHGLILRSACDAAGEDEIADDIMAMRDLAAAVTADLAGGPELLVEAPGAQDHAWREWSDPAPDEVDQTEGAFARHEIETMIDDLRSPVVALTAGASMIIEPTRALVAVDVNTGPDTSPAATTKANIAAARDLPRQLRLRGLGGQITVDFAPMPKKDRGTLEQVLRAAFKGEAAETTLAGWTPLGCFELQRKRDRPPLASLL